jgi:hypothetical protein
LNAQAGVVRLVDVGLAGVQPHAHPQLRPARPALSGERELSGRRRGDRVPRPPKGDEHGVPRGPELVPSVVLERGAQDLPMVSERLDVPATQLLEQPGRTLDVGEQEGDGPAGELDRRGHPRAILAPEILVGTMGPAPT